MGGRRPRAVVRNTVYRGTESNSLAAILMFVDGAPGRPCPNAHTEFSWPPVCFTLPGQTTPQSSLSETLIIPRRACKHAQNGGNRLKQVGHVPMPRNSFVLPRPR